WPVPAASPPDNGGEVIYMHTIAPAAGGVGEHRRGITHGGDRQAPGAVDTGSAHNNSVRTPGAQLPFGSGAAAGAISGGSQWPLLGDNSTIAVAVNTAATDINDMRGRPAQRRHDPLQPTVTRTVTRRRRAIKQPLAGRQYQCIHVQVDLQRRRT